MARIAFAAACAVASAIAAAGEQKYEPLSASVQAALHRSVADKASPGLAFASDADGMAWLAAMSKRMEKHVPDTAARVDLLTTVHYEATRAGLDPQLVLGVIQVESDFRKYAISKAGARGYMQVMPFWMTLIGESGHNLFNLRTNLRYGCIILRHYLDIERGDTFRALGLPECGIAGLVRQVGLQGRRPRDRHADGLRRREPLALSLAVPSAV
jgi:soluble lytic murein transglycosylase-like protein